jgi:ribonuclease VapC
MRNEPGAEVVSACLPAAVISTVNQAEVQAKLVAAGLSERDAWWHIAEIGCESVPFDDEQSRIAGGLAQHPIGLSLGDRGLALAIQRNSTVYTADAAWKNLGLPIPIAVIR